MAQVKKLPDGKFSFVVGVADPATGVRRQIRRKFAKKSEADRALAEIVSNARKGTVPAKRSTTFESFASDWLADRSRKVRPVTADGYRAMMKHANAAFGTTPIGDVTRAQVQRMIYQLADSGRSKRTAALTLFVVRSVLDRALDDGVVSKNVAARVEAVGKPPVERKPPGVEDLVKIWRLLSAGPNGAAWTLSIFGLRRSEVLGLQWQDVDFAKGTLTIQRSITADSGNGGRRHAAEAPKTRRGARTLPLPRVALDALQAMRAAQTTAHVEGWIVLDEIGQPLRPERWSDLWRQACSSVGVDSVVLHSARHACVMLMRQLGIEDWVIAKWHGQSEEVMRGTYGSHTTGDELADAGERFAGLFVVGG